MGAMPKEVRDLFKGALSLPADARAALAGSLIESLDNDLDESSEAAWREEIDRRIKQIDSGAVRLVPWEEAQRQLKARLAR